MAQGCGTLVSFPAVHALRPMDHGSTDDRGGGSRQQQHRMKSSRGTPDCRSSKCPAALQHLPLFPMPPIKTHSCWGIWMLWAKRSGLAGFLEKGVRKHERENCHIRKPNTAWKSILQSFWKKLFRDELRKRYIWKTFVAFSWKTASRLFESSCFQGWKSVLNV